MSPKLVNLTQKVTEKSVAKFKARELDNDSLAVPLNTAALPILPIAEVIAPLEIKVLLLLEVSRRSPLTSSIFHSAVNPVVGNELVLVPSVPVPVPVSPYKASNSASVKTRL